MLFVQVLVAAGYLILTPLAWCTAFRYYGLRSKSSDRSWQDSEKFFAGLTATMMLTIMGIGSFVTIPTRSARIDGPGIALEIGVLIMALIGVPEAYLRYEKEARERRLPQH